MTEVGPFSEALAAVTLITDARDRERAVRDLIAQCNAVLPKLTDLRRQAVAELRAQGMTQAEVARILGVSPTRISQLEAARPSVLAERSVPTPPAVRAAPSLFLAEAEAQNVEAARTMLHVGPMPAPPQIAELLGIEPGEPAMLRRKLQHVEGIPVRRPDSWHRLDIVERVPALGSTEFVPGGMERAFRAAGLTFDHAVESFTARHATLEERELLELDEDDDLVVEVLRCSYADSNLAVHCLDTVCVASRHRFRVPPMPDDNVF